MKIFLSVALWGRSYAQTFVGYALASQLSPGNIPKLAENHQVTYHVVTTRKDAAWMQEQPNFHVLTDHCQIFWDFIEDFGFLLTQIPKEKDGEKYPFMSRLQNIAFERSLDHDIVVFNYADFIWADGSLPGTAELMGPDVDAVLSFCLPVDNSDGKRALDRLRANNKGTDVLTVPPRVSAGIAIDHLHAEARLRMWDGPEFTSTPTYVLWPVGDEGLVVRAYHQTILALRVKADDPNFRAGIQCGSLDGYFSSELAESGSVRFADDSDEVLVFSLYEAAACTRINAAQREMALKRCLENSVSAGQRLFAGVPIRVKRKFSDSATWSSIERRSQSILAKLQDQVPADASAFKKRASYEDIAQLESRWRVVPSPVHSASRIVEIAIHILGAGVLCVLRSLYVGRLLRVTVVPWLAPSQQQWINRIGLKTQNVRWHSLYGALFNLGKPISQLARALVGSLKGALRTAAGRVGMSRVWGAGD